MAQFAVIETGGKQYKVALGTKLKVERLLGETGEVLTFDKVLLVAGDGKAKIGMPYLDGAKVEGKVIRQARDKKKLVFRFHSKTRYRKRKGHRQHFTEIEIIAI
jgi:large subunit ribosomal protein L21